jgi:hypothetical protein
MTVAAISQIGFCAHYAPQGDWAFELALDLARRGGRRLNIFHFARDPYDPGDAGAGGLSPEEQARFLVEREKRLRLYYDERLGDYMDVGFRLCEDSEWTELHRCLAHREFQLLVLAHPRRDATFGGRPILRFAHAFVCPLVLVGPDSPREYRLNAPAALLADILGFADVPWSRVDAAVGAPG